MKNNLWGEVFKIREKAKKLLLVGIISFLFVFQVTVPFENQNIIIEENSYDTSENCIVSDLKSAQSSIEHDITTTNQGVGDRSFSHSIGYGTGNNRLLLVSAGFEDSVAGKSVTSVTYNGQAMIKAMIKVADVSVTGT